MQKKEIEMGSHLYFNLMMWLQFFRNEKDVSQQHPAAIRQVTDELQYGKKKEEPERRGTWPQRVHQVRPQMRSRVRTAGRGVKPG